MKWRLMPQFLPPGLEWRWTRVFVLAGFLFTVAAVFARLSGRIPEAPLAYVSAGLLCFALGYWMRSRHLADQLQGLSARALKTERLAILGHLTTGFAHELKNSVMVTHGFAELARQTAQREGASSAVQGHLDTVERQSQQLLAELMQFLALTRGEDVPQEATTLEHSVSEAVRLLRPLARGRELSLEASVEPGLLRAVSEPSFRQAILNLGLNALEHAASSVRLTASVARGAVEIRVENDGAVLSAADTGRIFEPYVSTRSDGFGLGLAQVRRAVDREGGTVSCAPRREGGAVFTIRLPALPVVVATHVEQSA